MKKLTKNELTCLSGGAKPCRNAEAPFVTGLMIGAMLGTWHAAITDGDLMKISVGMVIGPFIVTYVDKYFYPECPQLF